LGKTVWVTDAGTVSSYQGNIFVADLADGVYMLLLNEGNSVQQSEVVVAR